LRGKLEARTIGTKPDQSAFARCYSKSSWKD